MPHYQFFKPTTAVLLLSLTFIMMNFGCLNREENLTRRLLPADLFSGQWMGLDTVMMSPIDRESDIEDWVSTGSLNFQIHSIQKGEIRVVNFDKLFERNQTYSVEKTGLVNYQFPSDYYGNPIPDSISIQLSKNVFSWYLTTNMGCGIVKVESGIASKVD